MGNSENCRSVLFGESDKIGVCEGIGVDESVGVCERIGVSDKDCVCERMGVSDRDCVCERMGVGDRLGVLGLCTFIYSLLLGFMVLNSVSSLAREEWSFLEHFGLFPGLVISVPCDRKSALLLFVMISTVVSVEWLFGLEIFVSWKIMVLPPRL